MRLEETEEKVLKETEEKVLKMFGRSADEPFKYHSNNLASGNDLVAALSLFQEGLVLRTIDEETDRAYFTISEKGFDYLDTIKD